MRRNNQRARAEDKAVARSGGPEGPEEAKLKRPSGAAEQDETLQPTAVGWKCAHHRIENRVRNRRWNRTGESKHEERAEPRPKGPSKPGKTQSRETRRQDNYGRTASKVPSIYYAVPPAKLIQEAKGTHGEVQRG
jgi:hypothetical protein